MRVPLNAPTFGTEEIEAAISVLRSGMVTMGGECARFEEAFEAYINRPLPHARSESITAIRSNEAVFVNSGSSANLIAFFALANPSIDPLSSKLGFRRIRPGDEVIVPALTWSTTVWPILQAGGIPVFVDSDPNTLQTPKELVEQAWSDRTSGVAMVHLLGNAAPVHDVKSLCSQRGVALIEDTCESLGTRAHGDLTGTVGDIGTYSFFFSHHITTIEGGMAVSKHPEIAELLRCLRAHGWSRHLKRRHEVESQYSQFDPRFLFVNMGFNVRPTEINAAFGLHQIQKLDGFNRRRVEIAQRWLEAFAPYIESGDLKPMVPTQGSDCTWFGFPCLLKTPAIRDRFKSHLENSGIETRPIVCGNLARQPALQHFPHRISGSLTGADTVMGCGIYWGSHPIMTDAEVDYVIQTVRTFFEKDVKSQ